VPQLELPPPDEALGAGLGKTWTGVPSFHAE
jgi:hypothetical protein